MKKRYSIIITLIVFDLLLFTIKDINFLEVLTLLKHISFLFIALAFLSYIAMFLVWNLRLQNTLRDYVKTNYIFLLKTVLAGVFLNTITPGSNVGGEPARAYFLQKKYGKQKAKYIGYILADKTFNIIGFTIFLALSILIIFPLLNISLDWKAILQIIIILLYLAIVIILISARKDKTLWLSKKLIKYKTIKRKFARPEILAFYIKRKIKSFAKVYTSTLKDKRKIYFGIFLSIVFWVFNFLASYFVFLALDQSVNFLLVIIAVTISIGLGDISPIPGGIGLVESVMILLYASMAVPLALGATVSLMSRFIYYIFAILIGGLSLLYLRFKYK